MAIGVDPSEGAYPSGFSATASAAHGLYLLTAERRYERAARDAMRHVSAQALQSPSAFGSALELMSRLAGEPEQLVLVLPDGGVGGALSDAVRIRPAELVAVADETAVAAFAADGFELFAGRTARDAQATAYLCRDFVCRLPVTDAAEL